MSGAAVEIHLYRSRGQRSYIDVHAKSYATEVYYVVAVGGVEITAMSNIVVPSRAAIKRQVFALY